VFERYTDEARKVVVLAQDEARRMDHNYVGTEHLLLGLLREKGVGEKVLYPLNVTEDGVRKQVETIVGYGEEGTGEAKGSAPFTPRAKKVFEYALREALQLGHNYIGTEYILLGLVRESEGIGARVLSNLGADAEKVRQEVVQRVGGGRGRSYGGSARKADSDEDGALTYLTRELQQVHREVHKLQGMNREMLQELSHLRKEVV
jgi:ATP-dependent Clp protease ATP-binding subunit ClpC